MYGFIFKDTTMMTVINYIVLKEVMKMTKLTSLVKFPNIFAAMLCFYSRASCCTFYTLFASIG